MRFCTAVDTVSVVLIEDGAVARQLLAPSAVATTVVRLVVPRVVARNPTRCTTLRPRHIPGVHWHVPAAAHPPFPPIIPTTPAPSLEKTGGIVRPAIATSPIALLGVVRRLSDLNEAPMDFVTPTCMSAHAYHQTTPWLPLTWKRGFGQEPHSQRRAPTPLDHWQSRSPDTAEEGSDQCGGIRCWDSDTPVTPRKDPAA